MKLLIRLEASITDRRIFLDTEQDFGLTNEEWNKLPPEEKESLIQEEVDSLEQPYWVVDKFDQAK